MLGSVALTAVGLACFMAGNLTDKDSLIPTADDDQSLQAVALVVYLVMKIIAGGAVGGAVGILFKRLLQGIFVGCLIACIVLIALIEPVAI